MQLHLSLPRMSFRSVQHTFIHLPASKMTDVVTQGEMKPDTWCVVKAIDFKGWKERVAFTGALCVTEIRHQGTMLFPKCRTSHSIPFAQAQGLGLFPFQES